MSDASFPSDQEPRNDPEGLTTFSGHDVLDGSLLVDGPTLVLQGAIAVLTLLALLVVADRTATGEDAFAPTAASVPGSEYEALARREDPVFGGFSAAEGRRIYFAEHVQEGRTVSCATCHTGDPRRPGRTPAGKVVEPLAPAANPDRLTDRDDVEKWFKRNCKQVLGRECSAAEKGHFVTFLLAP